jgi:CheY-like chemotaxis protein
MARKILLADDDRVALESISQTLREEGYVVEEAHDGVQALKLFDEERFDLVLSDILMPRVDGFGVLDHVRSLSPDTPIILMTGDLPSARTNALSRGATDCLLKPLELNHLLRKVEEVLRPRSPRFYSRH